MGIAGLAAALEQSAQGSFCLFFYVSMRLHQDPWPEFLLNECHAGREGNNLKKNMSQVGVLLSVNTWKMLLNFVHSSGWRSRRLSDRKAAWKSGFHSLMQTVTAILASLILYSLVHRRYPGSYEEHSKPFRDSSRTLLTIFTLLCSLLSLNAAPLAFMCI